MPISTIGTPAIEDNAITAGKLVARIRTVETGGRAFSTISNGSNPSLSTVQLFSNPFPADSGILTIHIRSLIKLTTRGNGASDALYYKIFKNPTRTSGSLASNVGGIDVPSNVNDTNLGYRLGSGNWFSDGWAPVTGSVVCVHNAGDTYAIVAQTDNAQCVWETNELNAEFSLIAGITGITS